MSTRFRYRVIRICEEENWVVVLAGLRVELETQSLPLTFDTEEQARKWTDFINARDSNTGHRKRDPGRVKSFQKRILLDPKILGLDSRSRLKIINGKQVGVENTTSINTSHRLDEILKNSTGGRKNVN